MLHIYEFNEHDIYLVVDENGKKALACEHIVSEEYSCQHSNISKQFKQLAIKEINLKDFTWSGPVENRFMVEQCGKQVAYIQTLFDYKWPLMSLWESKTLVS